MLSTDTAPLTAVQCAASETTQLSFPVYEAQSSLDMVLSQIPSFLASS